MKKLLIAATALLSFNSYAQVPQNGLKGHWTFTGNAINQVTGTSSIVNGATLTTDRFGNANSAYYFDGNDKIYTNSNTDYGVTNAVTISAWIKMDPQTTFNTPLPTIVSKYNNSQDRGYNLRLTDQMTLTLDGRDNSQNFQRSGTSTQVLNDGKWHHVTGIVNNDLWTVYIDGNFVNSFDNNNTNVNLTNSLKLTFGALSHSVPNGGFRYFKGYMDDITLYNRVLHNCEILQLAQYQCCVALPKKSPESNQSTSTQEKKFDMMDKLNIYPNPTEGIVHLAFDKNDKETKHIRVMNSVGQEVFHHSTNEVNYTLSLSEVGSSGVYFIQILNDEGEVTARRKVVFE